MTAGPPVPTQDDVLGYFDTLSSWGRWGDDDELGTLNHITDDVRLAASRAVRHGRSVLCAWEIAVLTDVLGVQPRPPAGARPAPSPADSPTAPGHRGRGDR